MGSIPRFTALQDHADVDVMAVLHWERHIKGRKPSQVLTTVRDALGAGPGSIRRNGQAVTIRFQSWPDVDVVPASRTDDNGTVTGYRIPDMNREVWLATNPPKHSNEINTAAAARGPRFRQVIKMLKDWNRRQPTRLQSYHIEVIALELSTSWTDHGYPIMKWFEAAQPACDWLYHEGDDVSAYLAGDQAHKAKQLLLPAERQAESAWLASVKKDHRRAITLWKSIFGQRFPGYG